MISAERLLASEPTSEPTIVSFVEQNLSNEICYSDFSRFFGCTQALDALFSFSQGERLYPAHAEFKYLSKLYQLHIKARRDEGRFTWIKVEAKEGYHYLKPGRAATLSLKAYRNLLEDWKKVYELEKNEKVFSFNLHLKEGILSLEKLTEAERIHAVMGAYSTFLRYSKQDSHAYVLSTKIEQENNLKGGSEWIGLGMQCEFGKHSLKVAKIFPGTPAEKMGLREGDEIIAINEFTRKDAKRNPELLRSKMTGKKDQELDLTVLRNGKKVGLRGKYDRIQTERVRGQLISEEGVKLGYLRLDEFSGFTTCLDFARTMRGLIDEGVKGWILDLRGNPGGDVEVAKCLGSYFLPLGRKLTEYRYIDGTKKEILIESSKRILLPNVTQADSLPMVTLVNAMSASASEMLASALRDNRRALVVGERTYGKGCMQKGAPLADGNLLAFDTQALYLRPNGGSVQNLGVLPDFEVYATARKGKESRAYHRREATSLPASLPNPFGEGESALFPGIEGIKTCMSKNGESDREWFREQPEATHQPDLQLHSAEKIVNCLLKTGNATDFRPLQYDMESKWRLDPLTIGKKILLPRKSPLTIPTPAKKTHDG